VQRFYAWLRSHPMLVDGMLAFFVALIGIGSGIRDVREHGPFAALVYLGIVVPLVFRRRYPVGAFVVVICAGALEVVLLPHPLNSDISVLIALYTLAAYRPRRTSVPGLIVCLIGSAIAVATWINPHMKFSWFEFGGTVSLFCGPALLAWLLGDSMRWRRGFYKALEDRAIRLEGERDAQAQIAVAGERARIARELHDVVAHNVSVMVVQADGAAYALDSSPERAREALAAISATGRQALAEMRQLLGVLRSAASDEQAALAPQPGLEQITDLLAHSRAAGLPVSFTVEGVARPLQPGVALAAYRVVQESLTNTRKHAGPDATASVALRFCEDGMRIVVTDDGQAVIASQDGAGHGLVGMRQRVELYGGTVTAAPRDGGGYQVTATIPFVRRNRTAA
jgi:signal transduction histidine kinase